MAVDLFFEYWLAMFLFPHKYAILFLFLKHPLSVFLIVDVSFPIVPFLLADDYFLQSNINNSHFWSLDHSSVFPVFLKSSIVDSMATRVLLVDRSEEHTSELQSRGQLVCRLLLDKT